MKRFILGLSKGVEKMKVYSYSFKEENFIPETVPKLSFSKIKYTKLKNKMFI
jgi:hypothetical protein